MWTLSLCLPWVADGGDVGGAVVPVLCVVALLVPEAGVLHGLLDLQLLGARVDPAGGLLVLVVPVLEDERDDGEADADEDDDEDAADVVDRDAAAVVVRLLTSLRERKTTFVTS